MDGKLFKLSNGNVLRVCSMCDDPEYEFGYDYFDGKTRFIIDGGVFNMEDGADDEEAIVDEAIRWCDLDPKMVTRKLIKDDCGYDDLEEMGYAGF